MFTVILLSYYVKKYFLVFRPKRSTQVSYYPHFSCKVIVILELGLEKVFQHMAKNVCNCQECANVCGWTNKQQLHQGIGNAVFMQAKERQLVITWAITRKDKWCHTARRWGRLQRCLHLFEVLHFFSLSLLLQICNSNGLEIMAI